MFTCSYDGKPRSSILGKYPPTALSPFIRLPPRARPSSGSPEHLSFSTWDLRKTRSPGILNTSSLCLLRPSLLPRRLQTHSPSRVSKQEDVTFQEPPAVSADCSQVMLCSPCLPGAQDTWIFPALFLKISQKKGSSHLP